MTTHMADPNAFLHYLCGPLHDYMNAPYGDDWTFDEENVTCEECLQIINSR